MTHETIRGDIITAARKKRGDVRIQESDRGGIQFRAMSQLDMLLEQDVITGAQFNAASVYWRLREALTREDNPLFRDVVGENEEPEEPVVIDELTIEDPASFLGVLTGMLLPRNIRIIESACAPMQGPRLIMIHAYGEGHIRLAFEMLEEALPLAHEEMKLKAAREKNYLQSMAKSVDSAVESHV